MKYGNRPDIGILADIVLENYPEWISVKAYLLQEFENTILNPALLLFGKPNLYYDNLFRQHCQAHSIIDIKQAADRLVVEGQGEVVQAALLPHLKLVHNIHFYSKVPIALLMERVFTRSRSVADVLVEADAQGLMLRGINAAELRAELGLLSVDCMNTDPETQVQRQWAAERIKSVINSLSTNPESSNLPQISPTSPDTSVARKAKHRWRTAREIADAAQNSLTTGGELKKIWDTRRNFYPNAKGKKGKQTNLYDPHEVLLQAVSHGDVRNQDVPKIIVALGLKAYANQLHLRHK